VSTNCCCCSNHLKDDRYTRLDQVIAEYLNQPGSLIPVLHKAQQIFGYLPDDVQKIIAEGLNLPLSDVYGVITFYSLFSLEPRGKHTIGICMGTACYVRGASDILEALKKDLAVEAGQTSKDGVFTLTITRCLGACAMAPVMMIDEDVYGRLTAEKIPEILAKYRQAAQNA